MIYIAIYIYIIGELEYKLSISWIAPVVWIRGWDFSDQQAPVRPVNHAEDADWMGDLYNTLDGWMNGWMNG